MKLAFAGKGGVGKTTLTSLFIKMLAKSGQEVLAVDCDPDSNLGRMLGFVDADKITPIAKMQKMIEERMGVEGGDRSFFKLNPKIDDIPDAYAVTKDNVKLIVMGTVEEGGQGCMCPESRFIKTLLSHLVLNRDEHLVLDMEAGLENFGRGTAKSCDFILAVVEPSVNSVATARKIASVARDIGIDKVFAVGNKVRNLKDVQFIVKELKDIKMIEAIDFDEMFLELDKERNVGVGLEKALAKLNNIKVFLEKQLP